MNLKTGMLFQTGISLSLLGIDFLSNATNWSSIGPQKDTQWPLNVENNTCEPTFQWPLNVENNTCEPTFQSAAGSSLIDLTLTNQKGNELVKDWDQEHTTLSDHNRIKTKLNLGNVKTEVVKLPKNTNPDIYSKVLTEEFGKINIKCLEKPGQKEIDRTYNAMSKAMNKAFDKATPSTTITRLKSTPWSPTATKIKQEIKETKKKKPKTKEDRDNITKLKNSLGKEVQTQNRNNWRKRISKINSIKELSSRFKAANKKKEVIKQLKINENTLTSEPKEMIAALANTHFPDNTANGCRKHIQTNKVAYTVQEQLKMKYLNKAVKNLKRNKAPGLDKVTNGMIIDGWEIIKLKTQKLMEVSLETGLIPKIWLKSKAVIIPKDGKKDYTNPKSYRIISLTSNILKIMERGVQTFLKEELKVDCKLLDIQHGFRKGKSTISALHRVTSTLESSLADKQFGLAAFLDIEGAFDKVQFYALEP
eukprot:sb/3464314/